MNRSSPSAVGIQYAASLSALGATATQLRQQLTDHSAQPLQASSQWIQGVTRWVGAYSGELLQAVPAPLDFWQSRHLRFALTALQQIEEAVLAHVASMDKTRLAIVVGTSTSGIADNEALIRAHLQGQNTTIWQAKQNMGCLAKALQCYLGWQGLSYTVSTACSSSAKALATAQRLLHADVADAVLVAGVDTLCHLTLNGFNSLENLSAGIAQPCGAARDGINIGEAASVFLLTKQSAAVQLLAAGESMDAWHISAPHPEGRGAAQAMRAALQQAQLPATAIDYLNLHGTATLHNDAMEIKALQQVFAQHRPAISSTKHLTGHCLGAAAALEAYICMQVLLDQAWLPLHHAHALDPALAEQNYVHDAQIDQHLRYVMSNSFAFGGSNISLIFATGHA
ncbi:beta-ketoacyl-ACP synthase [Acinetobacter larvae]|uniref:Beta-ketoacyl-[acyl-carrier-protein] synthase II n=1 Tax=Acinetobacter larvae TaxID=1789224 RepID=A0A1B2M261_9GAMM|nr:beta-ketoacyl-ACP synthase [Acinetobacter larvae]AOA59285.1 beta-ketoacyl-[acyl-carrier-protein] synthase II [Acinetobacter larvae]